MAYVLQVKNTGMQCTQLHTFSQFHVVHIHMQCNNLYDDDDFNEYTSNFLPPKYYPLLNVYKDNNIGLQIAPSAMDTC
jgi:hypothetical protein